MIYLAQLFHLLRVFFVSVSINLEPSAVYLLDLTATGLQSGVKLRNNEGGGTFMAFNAHTCKVGSEPPNVFSTLLYCLRKILTQYDICA